MVNGFASYAASSLLEPPEDCGEESLSVSRRARLGGPCRACGATLRHTVVDLGMSPLCESFVSADEVDSMEPYFPLRVLVCAECYLVQLGEYVTPEHIFREYAYFSSYSSSWLDHAKAYCEMIAERLELGPQSLVVELGSNDGYLLQHFAPLGVPVLGIEPSRNVAQAAIDKGIPTVVEFFGAQLARQLVKQGKQADCICGANVLAQVPDVNDFMAGIEILLKPEGVCTIEFPHLERLMAENQFDTIYHEHYSYFSAVAVEKLAERYGLKFFDVEELPTHGGSLRVYLAHEGSAHRTTDRLNALLAREIAAGFTEMETYGCFAERAKATKRSLLALLVELKNAGKTIVGYGAPGKGNTLLNYCAIGVDFVDFLVDRNPYKHGRYTPGMHIPIRPVEALDEAKPDYVLILPWNLKTEITKQMRHIAEWGGKFIVPIPEPRIINPSEVQL